MYWSLCCTSGRRRVIGGQQLAFLVEFVFDPLDHLRTEPSSAASSRHRLGGGVSDGQLGQVSLLVDRGVDRQLGEANDRGQQQRLQQASAR